MGLLVLIALGVGGGIVWRVRRRRRWRIPEQRIALTTKRWVELLDLQRRQDDQR